MKLVRVDARTAIVGLTMPELGIILGALVELVHDVRQGTAQRNANDFEADSAVEWADDADKLYRQLVEVMGRMNDAGGPMETVDGLIDAPASSIEQALTKKDIDELERLWRNQEELEQSLDIKGFDRIIAGRLRDRRWQPHTWLRVHAEGRHRETGDVYYSVQVAGSGVTWYSADEIELLPDEPSPDD